MFLLYIGSHNNIYSGLEAHIAERCFSFCMVII